MIGNWFNREDRRFLGKRKDSILFLGADSKSREIWLDAKTTRDHILVSGQTGSAKSELLTGIHSNAFAWGNGGIFVDGKGDVNLYAKMYALAEHHGRADDLLVLNFMWWEREDSSKRTHRFNPFTRGSVASLAGFVITLIAPDFWRTHEGHGLRNRVSSLVYAVLNALLWLRDNRGGKVDAKVLNDAISFDRVFDMAHSDRFSFLPEHVRKPLRQYMSSLPGFRLESERSQLPVMEQAHGVAQMQLARVLGIMAHEYADIFCAGESDIDFADLIANRRFLHVLLPALEKSNDDLAILGRIVIASLKHAISYTLHEFGNGEQINGGRRTPFIATFDDVSYYMTEGVDLLAAQAKSCNVALVFGCGDIGQMSEVGNTALGDISRTSATKIVMRGYGSGETLNAIFADVVAARDDVVSKVDTIMGGRMTKAQKTDPVFRSPSNVVRHLNEGEFVLINSGKMLIGRSNYTGYFIPTVKVSRPLAPLHDWQKLADDLILMTERMNSIETLQEVPLTIQLEFLRPMETASSSIEMLSLALRTLEPPQLHADERAEDEIVRIGE